MKTVVTGGCGFIGSHLTERLLKEGHHVLVLDTGPTTHLQAVLDHPHLEIKKVDIREHKKLVFDGIDIVFHLAALVEVVTSLERPDLYFAINVQGTLHVVEAAKKAGVKKLVYTASSSCYGHATHLPTDEKAPISCLSPYALTKYLGEEIVMHWEKVYRLPAISLRLFNVYGSRASTIGTYASVVTSFFEQIKRGEPLTIVGDGKQTRDFVHVADVADAYYQAGISKISGEIFNVGSRQEISINKLAHLFNHEITYIPKRSGEVERSCANNNKIKEILGWKPQLPIEKSIKELIS